MATKRRPTPLRRRNAVVIEERDSSDTLDDAAARTLSRPETQAAATMQVWEANYEVNALARELADQVAKANRGDLSRAEGMLMAQAHTLNAIFNSLARGAYANLGGGDLEAGDRAIRLALKAQSQCRATLATLAEIRNPMSGAYFRQANIATGPQQVNIGVPPPSSRAEEIGKSQDKLSGASHELLPDTRASQAQSCIDLPVEAVEEIHRAKDGGR
jgi:hypothetical protein